MKTLTTILWLILGASALAAEPAQRPNIMVIMADDMGFSDLGCYGSEIETPQLDRLAKEGLRFSQFYNCGLCGPSRSALMTGLHPHQVGISKWTGLLNDRCVTGFELLKQAGYATCAVGRLDMVTAENWHEPKNIGRYVDRYFGSTGHRGPGNYFKLVRNNDFYRDGELFEFPPDAYKTDMISQFAVDFIRSTDKSKPFYLYMSHYAPHWPLHAKPEDIAKYRKLYREQGWDNLRQQRGKGLVERGILPAGGGLAARDARAKTWEDTPHKEWEAERMAVYAAQIDCLDQSVGRVMEALREHGVEQNTLVFFLSDNGASDTSPGQLDRPGQTWRIDGVPTRSGNRPEIMPGPADTFVTAGPAWSCLSNTPFRGHKNGNFEGGIASPLIVWGPQIVASAGAVEGELSHFTDVSATVLDVAGVEYPARFGSREVTPLAGKSLLPVLKGQPREGHEFLAWNTSGARAIRQGDWKLVSTKGGPWQLYDLSHDRIEAKNLAKDHPERVSAMAQLYEEWRKQ